MAACRLLAIGLVLLIPSAAWGQPSSAEGDRTAWGAPDLQGVWYFHTNVPLESPPTASEAEAIMSSSPRHWRAPDAPPEETTGAYNAFWVDIAADSGQRTSQIIDPPDGRIPEILPGVEIQVGSVWADFAGSRPVRYRSGGIGTDGPEDRGVAVRCIVGFNSGPPMVAIGYNNNMQLFQTEDYVVILNEMVHDARIVPLDGRARMECASGSRRTAAGAPVDGRLAGANLTLGRFSRDTLVVETTNMVHFDKTSSFSPYIAVAIGNGANLTLVERFSRTDEAREPALRVHGHRSDGDLLAAVHVILHDLHATDMVPSDGHGRSSSSPATRATTAWPTSSPAPAPRSARRAEQDHTCPARPVPPATQAVLDAGGYRKLPLLS